MAALDSLYDKVLNEAWSKTIAGNGKNTLLVHTQAEFKPEDTYYVFVCKPVTAALTKQKYTWQTTPSLIDFSIGGNEENWSNIRIIEDKLVKGSDVVSYIKGKETKLLSGITQYILDLRYINTTVKDAVYASLHTSTKTGPGRFAAGYYFVNANIAGQPSLKTYYNIVKLLWKSVTLDLDPMYAAAETLPYIDDLIKAGELNKKNAELTGGDWNPAGLLEAVNWDDPYPYGKIDSIVTSAIKFYNPDFTDADVKDAYSAFYGWLQKHEELPDEMGVQEWYDNAVENFRDADQHERRGMDKDEEAAAEEGYINAAENLLTQQLNAFFNGDSEEYKDFLNARALNKKNAAATGGDWNPAGLLEGLQFDAGSEYFNYVDFCKEQGWSDEEIAEFSEWFATKSDMAEDINDYGDPEEAEAWWKVGSYFDAAIENAGYDAREHQDPTILLDHINDVKATIARYYRQFKDYKQAQALNQKNAAATGGDWEPEGLLEGEEICEQATLNPNGELIFGKYRIFQAGSGTQTAPYAQAINNTNLFSNRLANDVKVLETLGFKFDTVYYYQPPPRAGKYIARAIAISGTDNNGEDIMWVRKGGFMAPAPAIYYKDRRGGDVKRMARSLALQLKPANVVTAEDFLKAAVSPTAKIEKGGGWGYKRKKIKLRPDGKYDILGEVYLTDDYTKHLVGKPFVINSLDDLPVKFGVVVGQLTVKLPVLNIDWFPEKFDGLLYFQEKAGMTPERFLEAGLLDRVTDDTEISFTTGEKDKYGFNKIKKFKSKADWIDTIKAHELNKKNAEITGGDWNPAGLLEAANTEGRVTEFVKALIEVDNFENFKRVAKQLPDLSNTINGTLVDLLIQYAIFDNIGPLRGDGSYSKWDSIWYPSTPQDFFYKALYYYLRYHAFPNQGLLYKTIPSLEEVEQAFNKWLDTKQARDLEKKNAAATGGDWNPAGLLESWTDKDIEDYWEHYYNVGDPGPIGAIKNWPGLSFFNSWFVDMIDRENWNVDSIEDYFIEYSDRVADNLEQKDNEDRGYGELQEIACYRGYKKLYSYYRQFLSDTNSPFYKDWKATEELNQKNAAATGGDWNPSGLLEQGDPAPKKHYFKDFAKHYTDTFITILTKTRDVRTFNDFEAAFEGTNPHIWDSTPGNKLFHRAFEDIFKSEPLVKINSNNKYETTKFGHLYEAVGHYGRYFLLSKTDADKDRFSGEDARLEAALVYKKQAEHYFNNYIDIINAEELNKKNVAATGGDWNPAGLLEAYIWSGFTNEYLTDSFTKLIKKAAAANTFEEFLAAHDDIDPKIWSTAKAESSYFKTFQHIFNVDLYKDKDGTRGNFIGVDTKLGALYRAIERMGFYTVAAKTDHNPWHHNVGTKEYRIKSDLESAKKHFNTYKDIVDAEELNKKNVAATGGDWNPAGLLESNGSNIRKWIGFMLKAAEETAKNPKIFAMDSEKAERVSSFWTPVAPSDGTAEGIRETFLSAIKQVQNFDLQNGNFTPGKNTFKKMKYDPNRIGSLPSGYQIYVGDLSSPRIQKELKADLYNKAHRALYSWMEHFATTTGDPQWFTTIGPLPIEIIKDFINGDLKEIKEFLKDYLAAKELDKKNAAATGDDWNPAGLLESNKVFNPKIYDTYKKALEANSFETYKKALEANSFETYKKALEANSFEEFKELIKQLPDPWKYEVMVGGEANARAIIKDILKLKDFPSSYNPKTPADHFLTAVDHIFDVEHSTSVTLDDIRSGYAIAREHFAKWLDYKKAKELEQKNAAVTGGDWNPAGLLEAQKQDIITPERDKTLFFSTVENYKKYLPVISDADLIGFYDWFNNVKRVELGFEPHAPDNESSWEVYQQITYVAAEDEFGIPEHEISDEFRNVAEMMMDKLYDEYKAHLVNKKNAELTGGDWDPKGLLQEANRVLFNKRFALMKWARTIPNSNEFARQWALKSGFSEEDIENFGDQQWLIDGLIDWFVDMEGDKAKYQGGKIYKTGSLSQEEQIALYQKLEDDAVEEVKKHLEELYKDWMAAIELNKKNADVTGSDWNPAGLLEGRIPGGFNRAYFNFDLALPAGWRETIPAFRKWAETVSVHHYKVGSKASDEEYWQSYWDYIVDTWYAEYRSQGKDTDMTRIRDRAKKNIKELYVDFLTSDWYKDYLAAKELDQKNVTATGGDWDPKGLLEASTLALKSKEVKNAYLQKFVDLVDEASKCRSFREFEAAIKKANIEPSRLGHREEIRRAFRVLFDIDTIDSYTLTTGHGLNFKNKYGPLSWAINDFLQFNYHKNADKHLLTSELNQIIRDIESYFHTYLDYVKAEELDQKNVADTGGDWNPAGLLEAKQYTGPLGPVKDKQGKEHNYQGWYNIIKPFIIDLLKAVENNDFSSFVKLVDSRQKNMGGPGFNPYFNLVDKVYAKVLQELLDNEQAENAFDEAYSAVQSTIVYIDVHLKGQWDRDPNTLQRIPHAQIKQEYPRAVAAFNKFREIYKDSLDAKELDKKNVADTGGDWNPAGLLEAKPRSTPEEDGHWGSIIYDYIDKLVNANTFEEFMGLVEKKPATFQFNPGMYYHDIIFVNAINSILGEHDKETGNPVRSSFVVALSAIQGFVSYVDLFYKKGETTPRLEKDKAEVKKTFDKWIETRADWYAAQELNKKNAAATGGDWNPAGLLEGSRDVSSQEVYYNRLLLRWKKGFIDEFKEVIKLPEEEGEKVYQWLLNKATETDSEEPRMYATKAEEVYDRTAALYVKFVEEADVPGVKHVNRYKAAMKLIYKVYLDELKAQELNQKNAAATGGDWNPAGLLESEDDDSSRERYWDNALEATATDWINSFKSYVGLERANKIYTWLLNKARVEHDSQATYNNLIDIYGQFARERKKKDGLNDWSPPDSAKVLADIADAYDADKVEQKNAAATGGDWDPKGLL